MAEVKAEKSIATRRDEVTTAIERAKLPRNVYSGTYAMRDAGYIIQGSAESIKSYNARVAGAYLLNTYLRTLGYLGGQIFAQDVRLSNEESPIAGVFESMRFDADFRGNDLRTFASEFFELGMNDGARFLLVDYPVVNQDEQGRVADPDTGELVPRSRETDRKKNLRPYFYQFGYDQLLGWRYEYIKGVRTLTLLRLLETVTEYSDSTDVDDKTIEQVRVLRPGSWEIWRRASETSSEWGLYSSGSTSLPVIPLAVWFPGKLVSEMTAAPALEDLAFLCWDYFTGSADHKVLMAYVRRPVLFGKQLVTDGSAVPIGPGALLHSMSEAADLRSVGQDAASVTNSMQDLKDKKDDMTLYGLQMLTPEMRGSNKTATQTAQETAESTSQLKEWARSLENCFDEALKYAGMYEGIATGTEPEVELNKEFNPAVGLAPDTLLAAVDKGLLSKRFVFDEFVRRGLVADWADWEEMVATIRNETRETTTAPVGSLFKGLSENLNREIAAEAAGGAQ